MVSRFIYHSNPTALLEMLNEPAAREFVASALDAAVEAAKEACPVHTGAHRDAIVSFGIDEVDGVPKGSFGSTSPTWHLLEYGTADNPAYRPLTKGAETVGLKFDPDPRP